ncbi:MAG TPA: hypothetical protein VFU07_05155 [Candidatus Lumbricidophila sp.]|nr:hypothetical protein [Candidatus Lumbricidophila sp.]
MTTGTNSPRSCPAYRIIRHGAQALLVHMATTEHDSGSRCNCGHNKTESHLKPQPSQAAVQQSPLAPQFLAAI